jgi:hypothetical protein
LERIKKSVEDTIRDVIENPDEIYEDANGYRMYVKKLGGYIVVVFVDANGNVQTAYIPMPGRNINRYSDDWAIRHILRQTGFKKIYEKNKIVPVPVEGVI